MIKNFKKVLAILVSAMLLLGSMAVAPFTASAAVSDNLVPNGDFSNGMADWFDRGPGQVGTGVKDGMLYVGYNGSGSDYENNVNSQPVSVVKGGNYTLSFKIKGDADAMIMFAVKNSSSADGTTAGGSDLYGGDWRTISTDWQTIEVDFTVSEDANRDYFHVMFVPVGTGFYVDDVVMVQNLPDHGYISNGDFETGDKSGWTIPAWCQEYVSITADAAYAGNYGVKMTGAWANVQRTVKVNPNTTYKVTVAYKGDLALYFKKWSATENKWVDDQTEWCSDLGEWYVYECTYKTPADMTELYIEFGTGAGNLMIDNVTMTEVIPEFSGLVNGDFEGGNMDGWSGVGSQVKVTAAAAKDGSYGAHLKGGEWDGMYQWIDVKKNTVYKFSFDYMCVDTQVYGSLYVKGSTSNDDLLKDIWFQAPVGEWSSDGGSFNTGDFDRIYFQICKGNGEKYIDNIVLYEEGGAMDITDKLFNDDFELGTNQGWEVDGRNGVTDEEAHTGTYSMKVCGPSEWAKAKQKIKVEPNADYLVTYWVKCMGGSASLFKVADNDNKTVGSTEVWFYGAYDSWQSFSVPFNSGSNTEVYIQFEFAGGAIIYVDDINVQRYSVSEDVEILTNAGFESGWLEGYGLSGGGEVVDTMAHEGNYSLALNGSINKGRVWKKVSVDAETDYHLTFWANVNGSTASSVAIMDVTNAFSIVERALPITDGWEQVDVVFNSGDNETIYISYNFMAGGGDAYIDELNFVPYDTTGKAVILDMYLEDADKIVAGENLVPADKTDMTVKFDGTEKKIEGFNIPVAKDAVYVMTARVKGNLMSATNKGDVTFGIADPANNDYLMYVRNTMSTRKYQFSAPAWDGEWHTVSMIFQTGPLEEVKFAVIGTSADLELADITVCPLDKIGEAVDNKLTVTGEPEAWTPASGKNLFGSDEAFWLGGLGYGRHVTFANGVLNVKGMYELPSGMHYFKEMAVEPNTEYIFAFEFKDGDAQIGLIDQFGTKLPMNLISTDGEWMETGFVFNTGDSTAITFFVADTGYETSALSNLRLFKTSDAGSTDGWVNEDGKWAYYQNGAKVTNKWMKDSVGWCYLGADGYCVTNKWVADSVGWCYLDGNGRMVTNKWVMDSVGWCYLGNDGYCVTNKWVADSKGWCYLDGNGRMVTNKWVKDSVGWCYVGGDGYCVTNKWVADSKGWCYLDGNGRMVTNKWVKDSKGWCYIGEAGYCLTNTWVKDSVGWCYLDANGRMVYNTWVGGDYVGADGYWVKK